MNPPRLVLHAALAGLYGALVLIVFLRFVHPDPARLDWAIAMLPVAGAYTIAAAILWPLLYGAVRFFASRSLRVPRFSLRYALTFHLANSAPIMAAIAYTLWRARRAIDADAAWKVKLFLAAIAGAWAYTAVICLLQRLKRGLALQASAAGVSLAALLAPALLPLGAGDAAPPPAAGDTIRPTAGRLVWLNFDGADLEDLLGLQVRGKLPVLSRLRREGSFGRLESLTPCVAAVTRTTLVTGQLPWHSGVRGAWDRRLGGRPVGVVIVPPGLGFDALLAPFMERRALSIADRHGPALWDIVVATGGSAIAAGWEVDLDHNDGADESGGGAGDTGDIGPREARRVAADFGEGDASFSGAAAQPLAADLARALRADQEVAAVLEGAVAAPAAEGSSQRPAGVVALSFPGLDAVAHRFLRLARPAAFGNVKSDDIESYGRILERYYARMDALVGRGLALAGPQGWLFVTSSHGIEPAPLLRRVLAPLAGAEAISGTHDRAPGGFLFAVGPGVRAGQPFGRAALADVAPTALYVLGLPIARDLDGSIVGEVLQLEEIRLRPAIVIDTYGPRR